MTEILKPDICVIGAGSGGLAVAAGASRMGAATVLIESGRMGGDCLNYGCVPSKALIAAAHAAEAVRGARRFGVEAGEPTVDFARVRAHVQGVIAAIAPTDSVERFEGLGVRVIRAAARFAGPDEVVADGIRVRARRFVVATGSAPLVPPIPGLDAVPYRTNETIFDSDVRPDRLVIVGGGPIGCELAQAFRRLGAAVAIVEMRSILPKDDPEAVDVVRRQLQAEGVAIHETTEVVGVEKTEAGFAVLVRTDGGSARIDGTDLLVAAGRRPTVAGLDLEAAGIEHGPQGIVVDARLRTGNRRVYALGDVTGGYQFTHMAGYQAGIVLRNALFRLPAKVDTRAVPWVTFTDPELAQVGLTEAAARAASGDIRVLRRPFAENDRAQTERRTDGFVKLVTTRRGRVLGATIVGAQAGELVQLWGLAISRRLSVGAVAGMIAPYPTRGELNKRAAGGFYEPALFGPRTRLVVRLLRLLG